jgi:hypothetical protein
MVVALTEKLWSTGLRMRPGLFSFLFWILLVALSCGRGWCVTLCTEFRSLRARNWLLEWDAGRAARLGASP